MSFRFALPQELRGAVDLAAADWHANNKVDRFWQKDPGLWTRDGEEKWLGWIDIVERQQKDLAAFAALAAEVKAAGFQTALLLGMGGSSLCPEVLAVTFGQQPGFPALHIVDSTDPAQVKAARNKVNLAETLVVVASKSGSTLEPNVLKQYFFERDEEGRGRRRRRAAISWPSPTPARRWSRWPRPTASGTSSMATRRSAGASRRCRTLAWWRPRWPAWMRSKLLAEAAKAVASAKLAPADNPAVQLGLTAGHGSQRRTRQAHHLHLAGDLRPGRVAGAVDRRIHRQAGQGHYAGGPRGHRRAGRFTAATASSPTSAVRARPTTSQDAKVAASGGCRPSGRALSRLRTSTRSSGSSLPGRWPRRWPAR